MLKYAKMVNEETKQCDVGTGTNDEFYKSLGMELMEVEQGYDGYWYAKGFAPEEVLTYSDLRQKEYPSIKEQLDMIYWDSINGTSNWLDKISEIKNKYPKE